MPYKFYCRNWDFGYGHYNGFGARLVGVFFAWAWLRHDRLRAFDWAGLILISFVLPAVLTWAFGLFFRKIGWIKEGDLTLPQ